VLGVLGSRRGIWCVSAQALSNLMT
jgi:hypothetical protein